VDWVRRVLGGTCCRFGASLRSCCWWFFSSARWSIGSGSGGMDGNFFGPREQILWPASVLAGILMCGAVSFPRLVPPCFLLSFHWLNFKLSAHSSFLSNHQLDNSNFVPFNLRQSSCACFYLCPNPLNLSSLYVFFLLVMSM